jgi:hypothetical protein
MIGIRQKGDFSITTNYFKKLKNANILRILERYGQDGVAALASATPIDTGKTAASWYYETEVVKDSATIKWCNSNINEGVPIAIILQLGHGTGTGGWVEGTDYINPALKPVFEAMANKAWEEVTRV